MSTSYLNPRYSLTVIALVALISSGGCATVGSTAVGNGRVSYNVALQQSQQEQLLLNLVRLRYRDMPMFVEVDSIASQWEFGVNGGTSIGLDVPSDEAAGSISGGVRYVEKPTVIYRALRGEAYARRLMNPIDPRIVVLLYHSGWSVERVLRLTVQRMNGLPNAPRASGPTPSTPPVYEKFAEVAKVMRELQLERDLTLGLTADGNMGELRVSSGGREKFRSVVEKLSLNANSPKYTMALAVEGGGDTLAMLTRSPMGVMYAMSQAVHVPAEHEKAGLVTVTKSPESAEAFDWQKVMGGLFEIRSAKERPAKAYIAVRHRDHWFWIADDDLTSKSSFLLLLQLLSLQDAGSAGGPVLTLPVGG